MITTTLNRIRDAGPCPEGWKTLLRGLGKTEADDDPLPLETIIDINGVLDAVWCLRTVDGHAGAIRLYAVRCARRVEHLMRDPRSRAALDVAERHSRGEATDDDLRIAYDDAAYAAAYAATVDAPFAAAIDAAYAAAYVASASASASATASAAAYAASATSATAASAAAYAINAERTWQEDELRRLCRGEGLYADLQPASS